MKCRYEIDRENNIFIKMHYGNITVDGEIELLNRIFADPEYRKGMNAICDFTEASVDWGLDDIDRFRTYISGIGDIAGECKWAVVSRGGITNITARIFLVLHEAFQQSISLKLFSNRQDALAWIGGITVENTAE